ncbi:MAG: hypothetical protein P4L53_06820 [Candidatus Obscuribacterales bacterium]|nr:hypothetical protein [Candidatus Obscuribacterales bacterium]
MSEPIESGAFTPPKTAVDSVAGHHHNDDPDYFPTMGPKFGEQQKPPAKGKHSETPEDEKDSRDGDLSALELLKTAGKAFVHAAFEETGNGMGQLENHVLDANLVPEIRLVYPEDEGKLGSERWFAQTIGAGAGAILPYLAVDFATRRLGAAAAFLPVRAFADKIPGLRTVVGIDNDHHWYAPWAKATMDGGIYGAVLTPSADDSSNFWQQRGINGLTTSIAFGTQFGIAHGAVEGLEKIGVGHAHLHNDPKLDVKTIIGHVGSNLIAGTGTGIVGAESYSLLSNHEFASSESVEDTVAKYAVASVGLETVHLGVSQVLHKPTDAHAHVDVHAEEVHGEAPNLKTEVKIAEGEVDTLTNTAKKTDR